MRHALALRPVEVAEHDHPRAAVGQLADGGGQPLDPGEVRDAAVAHRHVEVGAHQHAPSPHGQPVQRAVRHGYKLPNSAAVSLMRELNPHSLSYQPATRTNCPPSTEAVCVASNEQENATWLKSLLTSLAVL